MWSCCNHHLLSLEGSKKLMYSHMSSSLRQKGTNNIIYPDTLQHSNDWKPVNHNENIQTLMVELPIDLNLDDEKSQCIQGMLDQKINDETELSCVTCYLKE